VKTHLWQKVANQCISLYSQNLSTRDIEKILGVSNSTVCKALNRNNIPLRDPGYAIFLSKKNDIPIPETLQKIIDGEMLGDGHITVGKYQSCFSYGTNQEEYARWLCGKFNEFGIPSVGNGVNKIDVFDERYNKWYVTYHFNTISTVQLHEQRQRWYQNGIKTVPDDLCLSRETLLCWWIGDGTRNVNGGYGWLETDSFSEQEVNLLSQRINDLLGTSVKTNRCRYMNKGIETFVHRIYIPRVSLEEIWHFIGFPPVDCYRYKWGLKSINHS
jgi:hypothetical protein